MSASNIGLCICFLLLCNRYFKMFEKCPIILYNVLTNSVLYYY